MGGSSTSHSAVLRGHKDATSSGLNLHSWQGLTEVLRAGKTALRDAGAYADFRNLVLEYAQKGGDVELRKKIDAIIATFSVENSPVVEEVVSTPVVPKEPVVEQKLDNPATSLPQETETHIEPAEVSSQASSAPQVATRVSQIGTRRMVPSFMQKQQPSISFTPVTIQDIPEKKQDEPAPITVPVTKVENPVEKSVEVPVRTTPPPPQSVPSPSQPEVVVQKGTIDEYKARITEIKHQVHERIGNPAALMDSQNDLGKKYMTALLSALKATGSGQTAHGEMATLEAVVALLLEHGGGKNVTPLADIPPTPPIVIEEQVKEIEKKEPEVEIKAEVAPPPVIPVKEEPRTVVVESHEPVVVTRVVPEVPSQPEDKIETHASVPDVVLEKNEEVSQKTETKEAVVPVKVRSFTPTPSPQPEDIPPSVTPPIPTPEPARTPQTESNSISFPQTELSVPEITASLHQLLDEWSIFGGSGLFGIGPGGAEHPLYKKIATLSMGEVVAGRWENADPKVVKVIKQYVDAWRHEQGVAYSITETFEHYLRRVVQRILKRQEG